MLNRYLILLSIIPLGLTASDPDPLCSEFFETGDSGVVHQIQRVESKEAVTQDVINASKELWEWTFDQRTRLEVYKPREITEHAFELNQQLKRTGSRPKSPNLLPAPQIPYVVSVEIPDKDESK